MSETESNPQPPESLAVRAVYWAYKSGISPILHAFSSSQCLYLPTCSEYAYVALHRFGPIRGSWLALRRVLRCHPFAKGGFDPVPDSAPVRGNPRPTGDSAPSASVSKHGNHLP